MNMQEYIEKVFGAKKWMEVKEALKIKVMRIVTPSTCLTTQKH